MTEGQVEVRLDEESIGRLLLRIESDVHRGGWDKLPWLYVLADAGANEDTGMMLRRMMRGAGPSIRVRDYLAQPMLGRQFFGPAPMPPWEALRNFAINLAYGEQAGAEQVATVLEVLRAPGVLGFAMVGEKWGTRDEEVARRAAVGEVNLGDVPGSVECRQLIAVTLAGQVMTVERVRGQKPELDLSAGGLRGDISTSLRILCDAVAGQVPSQEEFAERYPTLADLFAKQG